MTHILQTKVVVTLGPATQDPSVLERVMLAGADVFRCNFSHGEFEQHEKTIQSIRDLAQKNGKTVAILVDLQGPKIRIGRFQHRKIQLEEGQSFILDAEWDELNGTNERVGLKYKSLPNDVKTGDTLLLDDGRLVLKVKKVQGAQIHCEVNVGGELSDNKGINRLGGGLSASALTEKDRIDLNAAVKLEADFIAVSFPRSADDIKEARVLMRAAGGNAGIIAKIERAEALHVIDEIIAVSDAIMIARGDLGVEIGDADLPAMQKLLIRAARQQNKPVITATQMLETMIHNTIPTRAEVSDVANAVLDGTDAVMLSGETAVGMHPEKAVSAMVRICMSAESHQHELLDTPYDSPQVQHVDEAIAAATMHVVNHFEVRAIVSLTESGTTPLLMSRCNTLIPIYGLSRNAKTLRKMVLYRGVHPIPFDATPIDRRLLNLAAVNQLCDRGLLQEGDRVVITKGDLIGIHGRTNSLKIVTIGDIPDYRAE